MYIAKVLQPVAVLYIEAIPVHLFQLGVIQPIKQWTFYKMWGRGGYLWVKVLDWFARSVDLLPFEHI